MSMDKSAIEQIQKSLVAEVLNRSVDITGAQAPIVAMPKDFEILNLECFYPNRVRFRGLFETNYIEDFVAYTRKDGGHCFVDAERMQAESIMDLGTKESPGHAQHKAILVLQKTVPYMAVSHIDGSAETQQRLAEWLEDWREFLRAEDGNGEKIEIKEAIGAIRKITIAAARESEHEVQSLSQSRSTMEQIEAKSKDAKLPAFFYFTCTPYEQLKEREFMLRLSITTPGDAIRLKLRIARLEAMKEEIGKEFREKLLDEIDETAEIFIGTFNEK